MSKERLVAFSDGVFAVIITIMVLELKVPHGTDAAAILSVLPTFLAYVLSFVYIGIYWNNHHHLFYIVERIDGRVMWSNLLLLFFTSLVPFTTAWMGQNYAAALPTALYGGVLILAAVAYAILLRALLRLANTDSTLVRALGRDFKTPTSLVIYAIAIACAFVAPWISDVLFAVVAALWIVPDSRVERRFTPND